MDETTYEPYGRTWVSRDGTQRRIYFPETLLTQLIGLKYTTYKTGNIQSASLCGQPIANGRAQKILTTLSCGKAYFDCNTGELKAKNLAEYAKDILAGLAALPGAD